MESQYITYEQPLSEHMRVCLRLEQLFNKISALSHDLSLWNTQSLMSSLIDVLIILDRPDLKSKLTKALSRLTEKLAPLQNVKNIDQDYLGSLLAQLDNLLHYLINSNGKLAQNLRDNELLSILKHHHNTLGSPASMDTPAYYYWLQRSNAERENDINTWLDTLSPIEEITKLLLQLTRGSKDPMQKVAENGFFHQALNPKNNCRLIRITLPKSIEAYPEISVGPQRVNIRWYAPKSAERAAPIKYDIAFEMTCCD